MNIKPNDEQLLEFDYPCAEARAGMALKEDELSPVVVETGLKDLFESLGISRL